MDGDPCRSFRVQAGSEIPTIAIRKSLAFAGTIIKCLPTKDNAFILSFENDVNPKTIAKTTTINNVPIEITKLSPIGSRGTVFHPEFATWTLEDIQREIGSPKVLRRLPTKNCPAPELGRILLGFERPTIPDEVDIPVLGMKLDVKLYVPGPLRCQTCYIFGHHEKNCRNEPRCAICGSKGHIAAECRTNPPSCRACNRCHPISDRNCQLWHQERNVNTIKYTQHVSTQEARKIAAAEQVYTNPPTIAADNFPSLQRRSKRPPPASPPSSLPSPKRHQAWQNTKPTATTETAQQQNHNGPQEIFNLRLLTILENQGKMLEAIANQNAAILQILAGLRLTPLMVPSVSVTTPAPNDPPTTITGTPTTDQPTQLATRTPNEQPHVRGGPRTRSTSQSTPLTVFTYGRDTSSPTSSNVAGGILLAVRFHIPFRIYTQTESVIAVIIELPDPIVLVGVYYCPTVDVTHQLRQTFDIISTVGIERTLLVGDLNCRVGSCEDTLPESLPLNTNIKRRRHSKDQITNQRGSALLSELDAHQLVILNGRCASDPQGAFTFMSKQGCSLVDLIISSIVLSFSIVDAGATDIASGSDHIPIMTVLDLDDIAYRPNLIVDEQHHTRLRWNKELKATFNALLCDRLVIGNQDFETALSTTAKELDMSSKTRKPTKHITKPWFTKICVLLKKCCRSALSEWKRSNHNCDLQNYIFLRQNFIRATEQAKQFFLS